MTSKNLFTLGIAAPTVQFTLMMPDEVFVCTKTEMGFAMLTALNIMTV